MKALKTTVSAVVFVLVFMASISAKQVSVSCGGVRKINIDPSLRDSNVIDEILLSRSYPDCEVTFDTIRCRQTIKLLPIPKCRFLQKVVIGKYTSSNDSVFVGIKTLPMTDEKTDLVPIIIFSLFSLAVVFLSVGIKFNFDYFSGFGVIFLFMTIVFFLVSL